MQFLSKLFGSRNERLLKQYQKAVLEINKLEVRMGALPDSDLQGRTAIFKERIAKGESLESILPEAFAVCREASRRVLGMRHFDVQLIGAMALNDGKIAEMGTGEGKTLTSTLTIYLNALAGQGVHVVTVNDYLAKRDAQEMGRLFTWLGLTTSVNTADLNVEEKKNAYQADIIYGTNNEFGFDYLRDNMAYDNASRVQRGLRYAIIDEVDSVLIDEARTPLVISGESDSDISLFKKVNNIPKLLTQQIGSEDDSGDNTGTNSGDYVIDEKNQLVLLTDAGHEKVESLLKKQGLLPQEAHLYNPAYISLVHHLNAALRAHCVYHKDQHYVVMGHEIVIIDESTGRMMPGRRWSDGIHQAVEAKEGVPVQQDTQTLATITFQNFFRLYEKLSGMTGTADTEAHEFHSVYGLETVVIPPNRPSRRKDEQDRVYKTIADKYKAVVNDVRECHDRGQPVLVGTTSIENSELLSKLLKKEKLPHNVLNAKNHAREAEIIAQAGRLGAITIATNMAGRGTDIVLGGNITRELEQLSATDTLAHDSLTRAWEDQQQKVLAAGGLYIIGTERHASRRIDNQLRGRAGRQGDPGMSRFYLSFEDPLIRVFGGERVQSMVDRLSILDGKPIEAAMVTRLIESAQRKVEAHDFEIRKELLEYDNVANEQRRNVYDHRSSLLDSQDGVSKELRHGVVTSLVHNYVPEHTVEEQWDIAGLDTFLKSEWRLDFNIADYLASKPEADADSVLGKIIDVTDEVYQEKLKLVEPTIFRHYERLVMLQSIDTHWRSHLSALDDLRDAVSLRGYAQKDPKQEYKREAFGMFGNMLDLVTNEVVKVILTTQAKSDDTIARAEKELSRAHVKNVRYNHANYESSAYSEDVFAQGETTEFVKHQPIVNAGPKVGRNDACPCGSGKKYKQCHGK